MVEKLWLSVAEVAPLLGRKPSAIYEQIRRGAFPFVYRRGRGDSGAIYISARDIGLIPAPGGAEKEEAQEGDQSLATAAPAHA